MDYTEGDSVDLESDDSEVLSRLYKTRNVNNTKSWEDTENTSRSEDELITRRQNLDLKLANTQFEETIKMNHHQMIMIKLHRLESILQTLIQYIDSIRLEEKYSVKICEELDHILTNDASGNITEPVLKLVQSLPEKRSSKELSFLQHKIYKCLSKSKTVHDLDFEYNNRKKDYILATQNYRLLLQNGHLSEKQLNHLQKQYEGILVNFEHSLCLLQEEVPHCMKGFVSVLLESFKMLSDGLLKGNELRGDVSSLLKLLSNSLLVGDFIEDKKKIKEFNGSDDVRCVCNCGCMGEGESSKNLLE